MCADHLIELKYIAFVNDRDVRFEEDALTGAHCLASKTVHGASAGRPLVNISRIWQSVRLPIAVEL